jgi:hypothetical protein
LRSKKTPLLALALVAALIGAACGGGEDNPDSSAQASEAAAEPSPTPDPPECPLTGEEPSNPALVERPAVAVKIENSPQARPQTGLENADVVFEEIVEGGITRFLAVYHCSPVRQAGPVRSARFDDPKIALPFTSVLAYSGANAIVEGELQKQGMTILNEDTAGTGLFRDPPGSFDVHSLYANVNALLKTARKAKVDAPAEVFTFGESVGRGKKARRVAMNFTPSNTIEYRWEGGSWKRYEAGVPFVTSAGAQISVANLVIQQVDVNRSPNIVDVAGNPSPDINLNGEGKALLFRDGRVFKGTWSISDIGEPSAFTLKSGEVMTFAPGNTWIELVPSGAGTVKGTFSFSKK